MRSPSFAPLGLVCFSRFPTASEVGCILTPLRGQQLGMIFTAAATEAAV
jgi:hypothetical protein